MTPAKKWLTVDKLANNQPKGKRDNGYKKTNDGRSFAFVFDGDMKHLRSRVKGKNLF